MNRNQDTISSKDVLLQVLTKWLTITPKEVDAQQWDRGARKE
ncbi:MAG: hypothetical protein ACREIJ_12685 [Nitrospiraceae bacterium]